MSTLISGTAAPNATILYVGDAFGAATADGSGNYSITVGDGTYILSSYAVGFSFNPSAIAVEVSGADVPDQNFTPVTLTASSPIDSRVIPNLDRVIQDSQIFDVDGQPSHAQPLDCRKAGPPVDSRVAPPLNSRS